MGKKIKIKKRTLYTPFPRYSDVSGDYSTFGCHECDFSGNRRNFLRHLKVGVVRWKLNWRPKVRQYLRKNMPLTYIFCPTIDWLNSIYFFSPFLFFPVAFEWLTVWQHCFYKRFTWKLATSIEIIMEIISLKITLGKPSIKNCLLNWSKSHLMVLAC